VPPGLAVRAGAGIVSRCSSRAAGTKPFARGRPLGADVRCRWYWAVRSGRSAGAARAGGLSRSSAAASDRCEAVHPTFRRRLTRAHGWRLRFGDGSLGVWRTGWICICKVNERSSAPQPPAWGLVRPRLLLAKARMSRFVVGIGARSTTRSRHSGAGQVECLVSRLTYRHRRAQRTL